MQRRWSHETHGPRAATVVSEKIGVTPEDFKPDQDLDGKCKYGDVDRVVVSGVKSKYICFDGIYMREYGGDDGALYFVNQRTDWPFPKKEYARYLVHG